MPGKILLVTGTYLPEKNGGIENYTHSLALLLTGQQYEVEVAALNVAAADYYFYEGIKIYNLGESIERFENVLKAGHYHICHIHEYSAFGGIELPWFKTARAHCTKVFFTFHLPYLTCYKKDFRYFGKTDCDHFTDAKRCSKCIIQDKFSTASLLNNNFALKILSELLQVTGKKRSLNNNIENQQKQLKELLHTCDQVFVIAQWFKDLLVNNGYGNDNVHLIPSIVSKEAAVFKKNKSAVPNFKLLFAGRIQHQKGLHLLCQALQLVNTKHIKLEVYGNLVNKPYYQECQKTYPFEYKGIIAREELLNKMNEFDFLVLPSVFTEMKAMVIEEAFANELPVIASSAKGNKEQVIENGNGFLFNYDDARDLAATIDTAYRKLSLGWYPEFKEGRDAVDAKSEIVGWYNI